MGKIVDLDFKKNNLRKINSFLQSINHKNNKRDFIIKNPNGNHAICAGLKENMSIIIKGHVGYYCGGMNQNANITINGNAGTGLGENMMSGLIHVKGNVSQSVGASADCIEKKLNKTDIKQIENLLKIGKIKNFNSSDFRKFGSQRKLYNFNIDNVSNY